MAHHGLEQFQVVVSEGGFVSQAVRGGEGAGDAGVEANGRDERVDWPIEGVSVGAKADGFAVEQNLAERGGEGFHRHNGLREPGDGVADQANCHRTIVFVGGDHGHFSVSGRQHSPGSFHHCLRLGPALVVPREHLGELVQPLHLQHPLPHLQIHPVAVHKRGCEEACGKEEGRIGEVETQANNTETASQEPGGTDRKNGFNTDETSVLRTYPAKNIVDRKGGNEFPGHKASQQNCHLSQREASPERLCDQAVENRGTEHRVHDVERHSWPLQPVQLAKRDGNRHGPGNQGSPRS